MAAVSVAWCAVDNLLVAGQRVFFEALGTASMGMSRVVDRGVMIRQLAGRSAISIPRQTRRHILQQTSEPCHAFRCIDQNTTLHLCSDCLVQSFTSAILLALAPPRHPCVSSTLMLSQTQCEWVFFPSGQSRSMIS